RFSLGYALLQQNQIKEGVEQIKQAVILGKDAEAIVNYVQSLNEMLDQHQCPLKGEATFSAEVGQAAEAATQGEGDPKPMALFKKKFAAALAQHECGAATSARAQPQ